MIQSYSSLCILSIGLLCAPLMGSSSGFARFAHQDAQRIDPLENASSEFYNDVLSYRYPLLWQESWEDSRNGFRANAGSLDIRRFSYLQEIKLESPRDQPLIFGYRQQTHEDTVNQSNLQELRVSPSLFGDHTTLTLLGDCGFQKEYGDLGFELSSRLGSQFQGTYRFWNVDAYYSSKKEVPQDSRPHITQSHEARLSWLPSTAASGSLGFSRDTPLTWSLLSEGYEYRYGLSQVFVEGTLPLGATQSRDAKALSFRFTSSTKFESMDFTERLTPQLVTRLPSSLAKNESASELRFLKQTVTFQETEAVLKDLKGEYPWYGGLWHLAMESERQYSNQENPTYSEKVTINRRETALYFYLTVPFGNQSPYLIHHGAVANKQHNNYLKTTESIEVKYIAALELNLAEKTRFLLNSTWDLDQLAHDAPFQKRSFRPWGGGNLQVTMIF